MNPSQKVRDISIVAGLIITLLVSLLIASSQRELSISSDTQAYTATPTPTQIDARDKPRAVGGAAGGPGSVSDIPLVSDKQFITTASSSILTELRVSDIVSNYTSDSMNIVWYSEAPTVTDVRFGFNPEVLSRFLIDEYTTKPHYIHSVQASGLTPGRQYYYSGTKTTPQNALFPQPKLGQIQQDNTITGTIKGFGKECLVRGYAENASGISTSVTVVSLDGSWTLTLKNLLTQDYSSSFQLSEKDTITLDFLCVNQYGRKSTISLAGALDQVKGTPITVSLPAFE